jgi:hypothetical protein
MSEALNALQKEGPCRALICIQTILVSQPALDRIGAVFGFPFLQDSIVAALDLNDFTRVRILVNLDGANLPGAFGLTSGRSTAASRLRVEDGDDVAKAVTVLA